MARCLYGRKETSVICPNWEKNWRTDSSEKFSTGILSTTIAVRFLSRTGPSIMNEVLDCFSRLPLRDLSPRRFLDDPLLLGGAKGDKWRCAANARKLGSFGS